MKLRKCIWLLSGVLPLILTACQIVPAEEALPDAPVMQSYEVKEYKETAVKRGDISLEKTVRCSYVPTSKELLSFSLGGEYIDQIYVAEGQTVKKGELLAELVKADLEEQIDQKEYSLAVLQLKLQHTEELRKLKIERLEVTKADAVQIADTDREYRLKMQDLEDQIYIEELRLEELRKDLQKRQIYAGIDGTITYLREVKSGTRSVEGQLMMSLADMDSIAFTVTGDGAEYLTVGTEAVIRCNMKDYPAVAVEPAELGQSAEKDGQKVAYLRLLQPDPTIEDGATGTINVVVESAQDVLYLEKKAVKASEGTYYVAILNEDGWKVTREIEVGLVTNDYVEIVDGLKEGDLVIME